MQDSGRRICREVMRKILSLGREVRCRNGATVGNKRTSNIFCPSEGKESGVSCIE